MIVTVTDAQPDPKRAEEVVAELKASGALDELFSRIDSGEVEVTGDGGLVSALLKEALERGVQAEMTSYLGYAKDERAAKTTSNARNGSYPKTVASGAGDIQISVPRDREGSFTPRLVPKGSRRLGGLDDMIISVYAGGMTIRDIQYHLATTIGTELSHETIANTLMRYSKRCWTGRTGHWRSSTR